MTDRDLEKRPAHRTPPAFMTLPGVFYDANTGADYPAPSVALVNERLAGAVAIDRGWFDSEQAVAVLSGQTTLHGDGPVAMAYAGHQFGHYNPLLGDGRALLVGELIDADGAGHELHLKGSGPTRFSRGGDGRATIGAAIREYIVSEAMACLGVPTTQALAILTTGERVVRHQGPVPGAILARTAKSHIRVGTFQYAAALGERDLVRALADFVIERLFPDAAGEGADRYCLLLKSAALAQADLIAKWTNLGFIHGVMNTDNMALSGETIDYGPCAFMDRFHPAKVFSSIDHHGRYAWNRQGEIGLWNLSRLAEALLPLFSDDQEEAVAMATNALKGYAPAFEAAFQSGMAAKLGLVDGPDVAAFMPKTFSAMAEGRVDFTRFFRALTRHAETPDPDSILAMFDQPETGQIWLEEWQALAGRPEGARLSAMKRANPVRIPRNHLVEQAIIAAEQNGDLEPTARLIAALSDPYVESAAFAAFEAAPTPGEEVRQTFCGT